MNILENSLDAPISYASQSGFGNDVTLRNVELRAPKALMGLMAPPAAGGMTEIPAPGAAGEADDAAEAADDFAAMPGAAPASQPMTIARAETLTFKGLTLKDGKPVARDIVATNIVPAQDLDGTAIKLGSLSFTGMNEATGRYITALVGQDMEAAAPPFEAWGFDKASLAGLSVGATIPPMDGKGGSVNVQLGELSFGGMADRKVGQFLLNGLKGDLDIPGAPAVTGTFDLGRFQLGNLNLKYFADYAMVMAQPFANPGEPADFTAFYAASGSPLETGMDSVDWTGANADISGIKFNVSPVHIASTRNAEGVVTAINGPRYTMTLKADPSGGSLGAMSLMGLAMMGYPSDTVEMFFAGEGTFDPEKDYTRWDNYQIGVKDLADVKISVGLIGLQKALPNLTQSFAALMPAFGDDMGDDETGDDEAQDGAGEDSDEDSGSDIGESGADAATPEDDSDADMGFSPDPAAMMSLVMGLLPLQLTDLDIEITDAQLLDLIVGNQAAGAGQSPEAYRADLVAMIAASSVFMSDAGLDTAIAQELTAAASGFMSGPGTLRLQLKPKTPLGVMSAFASPMTKENLGFSATFTPAAPKAE